MSNLTLRAKLTLAFMAVLIGLLAISLTALFDLKGALEEARRGRIKAITHSATATIDYFQKLQAAGSLSEEEAKRQAIASLRQLRFDGDNYVWACKNFCVNGHLAGNCRAPRSDDGRSKESSTEGVAGQPAG